LVRGKPGRWERKVRNNRIVENRGLDGYTLGRPAFFWASGWVGPGGGHPWTVDGWHEPQRGTVGEGERPVASWIMTGPMFPPRPDVVY